ncbi:OmpA family protein [Erythrobacter sp. SD-21]|uniref:OmpA family protein n=1 Tax=Erythrobacter sp. SD-21 TaxID=161528 RepID=UPI000153FB72|nr:OmpA family protein [Erythrobacter sp. SD-21]EDL48640.1 putative outer membrane lipoprotein [Erythrobacter sp. SD-21]
MRKRAYIPLGALLVIAIGSVSNWSGRADRMAERLSADAGAALAAEGLGQVKAQFANRYGAPSRHPVLSGGERLDDVRRTRAAQIVSSVRGVGGVSWVDGSVSARSGERAFEPLHCQEDVDGLLRTRTIRFQEASAALLPASRILLDEVAAALEPCSGAIIAITGHTNKSGSEAANLALSMDRARVVREALVRRGIPRSSLRARGMGSSEPAERLKPEDPANRRIEFSVIRLEPLTPTPVDMPGPR